MSDLQAVHEREPVEVGSEMKGSGLYLAKTNKDRNANNFAATKTNLMPS